MSVAIIDYGSGNLHSAAKAFERAAREEGLSQPITVTSDPDQVRRADRVVLPGVGAFADCRRGLDAVPGMVEALKLVARTEAILLDPVYSGKGMDGLIDQIKKGFFAKDSDVVFLHTGGAIALCGYPDVFGLPGYV